MSQLKPLNAWNATPDDVPRVTSVLEAWDESPTLSVMIALAKDLEIEKRKAEADLRAAQIRALEWGIAYGYTRASKKVDELKAGGELI